MDQETQGTLSRLALEGLEPVTLQSVMNEQLKRASEDRTLKEFSITCKSFFMFWLLKHHPELEALSFADSDMFFYSDPEAVFAELGAGSVGITEHRFPARLEPETSRDYGTYNGGWVTVRRDANGMACIEDWSQRSLDWCYDRLEDGKYGDQKYLVEWPKQFKGVVVLQKKGTNLAPWNVENYTVTAQDGQLKADDDPVVFYHFSGLRQIARWPYRSGLYQSGLMRPAEGAVRRWIYRPYLRMLRYWEGIVGQAVEPDCGFRTIIENRMDVPRHLWSGRFLWKLPVAQ
jgi:hypothetical protein